ncbi:replicative DNA helicase, partial [Nevskia ramosa]|uniref:replicative DNA helicase n=1 Tax=Nevskia ramosa TaxID=64002 RepID=UPI0023556165
QVLVDATEAAKQIVNLPIYVDYSSDDLASISARARRMKRKENIELLIVDYLQLVGDDSGSGRSNRVEEVGRISRGLKRLAVQLQIPIVALAQLNRSLEVNGNRRPQLSDLREAGSIEQDADFVMFLWRHGLSFKQEGSMPTSATNVIEAIFSKGREIEVGTEYLRTEFEHARFRNMMPAEVTNYLEFIKQQNAPPRLAASGGGFGS